MKIIKSFKYACEGIISSFKAERNMKIHILIMILVTIAGCVLKITKMEWMICIILFGLVISGELFNTTIETIVDMIMPEKNEKANSVYDSVYIDLKYQIIWYVETWARLCSIAFKDKDYRQEKHTWIEWYEITKCKFMECEPNRQEELMNFFNEQLLMSIEGIEKALKQIESQQYILNISGIYDENLKGILEDYSFEFHAAKLTLERNHDKDEFWSSFDAIKGDLVVYIHNWVDIRYYNYYRFKPYNFHNDKAEIMYAMLESEKNNK